MKSLFKKILYFILFITLFISAIFYAVYFDASRQRILNYFQNKGYELTIGELTYKGGFHVKNIKFHSPSSLKFSCEKLQLLASFSGFSISANNLSYSYHTETNNSQLSDTLYCGKIARKIIKYLDIRNICFNDVSIKSLQYVRDNQSETLECNINEISKLYAISCRKNNTIALDVSFTNLFNFNGKLKCMDISSNDAKYDFQAYNDKCKISAKCTYNYLHNLIKTDDFSILYKNNLFKLDATANVKTGDTKINTFVYLKSFYQNLDESLCAICDIHCNVRGHGKANIKIKQNENIIGNIKCNIANTNLKFFGNFNKLSFKGYDIKNIDGSIFNLVDLKLDIIGSDFEVQTRANLKDQKIDNLQLLSSKGHIKLLKPFRIGEISEYSFDFNQLNFFDKFIPISGKGNGEFSYNTGNFEAKAFFQEISFENHVFHALQLTCNANKIFAHSKHAKLFGTDINDISLDINDGKALLKCGSVNKIEKLHITGEVTKDFHTLSIKKCEIPSQNLLFNVNSCVLDFFKKKYKVDFNMLNKQYKKLGSVKCDISHNNIDIAFDKFAANRLNSVLQTSIPKGILSGSISLHATSNKFNGTGSITMQGILSRNNTLTSDIELQSDGIKINSKLINSKDFLNANIFLPISISTDLCAKQLESSYLNCKIQSSVDLENAIELSDNSELRGKFECDISIVGNFKKPSVKGHAKLIGSTISVGNVILKNGNIHLSCNGSNKIDVVNASFIDDRQKSASITGNATLFFKNFIPDLNTNLDIQFDNFLLFDSDNYKIAVHGPAKMFGPISDMHLSGDVHVTECKLQNFSGEIDEQTHDINVINTKDKRRQKQKNDSEFFTYDVMLRCRKIEIIGSSFIIEMLGDLKLSTCNNESALIGDLKLSSGKLDLFGKRMKFTAGEANFFQEFPYDPKASFTCKRNFGDMQVSLNIKNSPKKGLSLSLQSVPNYSTDIILSMMLFGKELQYLSVGEAAQLAHAVASLKQKGYIFTILNTLQRTGIVDSVTFSTQQKGSEKLFTNNQNANIQNNINISAGKYIHDNVFVSVNKKEDSTTFDIDLSISPTVSVKANTAGETGISWQYKY